MKKEYQKPVLEVYSYRAEQGYALSVALKKDQVLIEAGDESTMRVEEQVSEFTDESGYFTEGEWE
ncbi:MAG: hypothetical protein IJU19_08275 [Bacteroidales bacterium]|nr:hypothetical protein [Bacteroidales bacterium]